MKVFIDYFQYMHTGKPHEFLTLDKLASVLTEVTVARFTAEEDKLEQLFKNLSRATSEFEWQTTEMLRVLQRHRDEQVYI